MLVRYRGRLLGGTFGGRQREAREQQRRERRIAERVARNGSHTPPVVMNGRRQNGAVAAA